MMIHETITFRFENEDQQKRFHARLDADEGFANQVWGLSLLAQAELDNGDVEGALKTLVKIAEVASEEAKLRTAPMPTTTITLSSGRTVEVEYTIYRADHDAGIPSDGVADWWTLPKDDPLSPSEIDEVEAHFSSSEFEIPEDNPPGFDKY